MLSLQLYIVYCTCMCVYKIYFYHACLQLTNQIALFQGNK